MNVATSAEELRETGPGILVPTMGALHRGHHALISVAASIKAAEHLPVLVSIFVNPTQFGPGEDFDRYPRQLEQDIALAVEAGADVIFAPSVDVVYPSRTPVDQPRPPAVATEPRLEDAVRPDHFAGVCQVVARLFDLTNPAIAIFGEKDYQQLLVIRALVSQMRIDAPDRWRDLRIEAAPTIREDDGLALSSRNEYLDADERRRAIGLSKALQGAQAATTPADAERRMHSVLHDHNLFIDYAVARDATTLLPVDNFSEPVRLLIAARCGATRLIDNAAFTGADQST